MARLYEYQGKELLRGMGIPVPRGRAVRDPIQAAKIAQEIGLPVAIKAQVLAGRRGKSGGIRFATTLEEVRMAARALFREPLHGIPVEAILVEERLEIRREIYLAVTADPSRRQPVVLVSLTGGVDIEETAAQDPRQVLRTPVNIREGLLDHAARNILRKTPGATSADILSLAPVLCSLYRTYRQFDCKLVEINPVALTSAGPVAADARVDIDDDAIWRHPELGLRMTEETGRPPTPLEVIAGTIDVGDHRGTAHFVQLDPDGSVARELGKIPVAFDCVGTGASLTTMDELVPLGYYPVNFADTSGNPSASKMYRITKVILAQPQIQGYLFISCISSQQLDNTARGIVAALKEVFPATGGQPNIPMLFAFRGAYDEEAVQVFRDHGIAASPWVELLGREVDERDAALAFHKLHRRWRDATGSVP
ncbi:MAG: acetate--CoA ligase family protein [candidate division NC10 bacterium]|nr:acetate--CoA ligase family protein [candidate division NC10 bacterium]